jgi:hypothetical protein
MHYRPEDMNPTSAVDPGNASEITYLRDSLTTLQAHNNDLSSYHLALQNCAGQNPTADLKVSKHTRTQQAITENGHW